MRAPLIALLLAGSLSAHAENVLAHRQPIQADTLGGVQRLTNVDSAFDGDPWDGPAALLLPMNTVVEWDLGAPTVLDGAAIQADNNDEYLLQVSDDGSSWRPFVTFRAADGGGLRTRVEKNVKATARYVQLSARGGDGRFSVTEIEVFSGGTDGSNLLRAKWVPRRPLDQSFIAWLLGVAVLSSVASRRLPRVVLTVLALVGLGWSYWLCFVLTPATPGALISLPWARAAVALGALIIITRERLGRSRWPSHPAFTVGGLGVTAAMAMWCFLNLGMPQFRDASAGRGTWLHHYDMRTYYPIAKYFPELRFDGVYAASVMVVADGKDLGAFANQPIRDLRTHVLTTVGQARPHLEQVRQRFSDERWRLFVSDMTYFRRAMGDGGFLGSMNDHGGNATPVWFLSARALFADADASDGTMWNGVIADMLLLALAFLAIGWAWGTRTALLAITVFGAMDFYQFGSNWFGASLRHDWLSLWAIGVAMLHKRKYALGGAALAWSAWIRAFPALTLLTLSFPVIFVGGKALLQGRRDDALTVGRPWFRVIAGVLIATVVLVGLSIVVFGADSWTEWLHKVQTLDKDNHVNNISFRTYIDGEKSHWYVAVLGAITLLFVTLRRASMARAAAWGVALLPIVFNPANYYLHSAFLLVTLAGEHASAVGPRTGWRGYLVWAVLLMMCAASYLTSLPADIGVHFRMDTIVAFVALGLLWLLEIKRPRES